jgi:hypothetical protein
MGVIHFLRCSHVILNNWILSIYSIYSSVTKVWNVFWSVRLTYDSIVLMVPSLLRLKYRQYIRCPVDVKICQYWSISDNHTFHAYCSVFDSDISRSYTLGFLHPTQFQHSRLVVWASRFLKCGLCDFHNKCNLSVIFDLPEIVPNVAKNPIVQYNV